MRFAVQHNLVPGASLSERFQRAAEFGFEAVEVTAWGFPDALANHVDEIRDASEKSGLPVSSLCTMGNDDFVHPELAERRKRLDGLVTYLEVADAVGAKGVVALPIRPPLRFPDLSPVATERELITQVAVAQLTAALERTAHLTTEIFLEPLNRYEASYLKTLADGVALCQGVANPRCKILTDLFHMNIEEADMAGAVADALPQIGAVHLADSNRLLPGHGHTDFVSVFQVLQRGGYSGFCALECGIPGNPLETLPRCANFLKELRGTL